MTLLQRYLSFDEPTLVEWRRLDGAVLQQTVLTPVTRMWLLLDEIQEPYDVYAQAVGRDWRLIYEVRPQDNGGLIVDWKSP